MDQQSSLRLQCLVNRDARLRSFGSGDDGKLNIPRCIADHVNPWDARLAEVIGPHSAFKCELATEPLREVCLLRLR